MPFVDLVLVIDHSGSMEGLKLKMVRNTIKALMGFLREDDRVSVVIFDDKALRLTPLVRLTETNRQLLSQTIDKIEPDGGTNIHLGLEFALEILKRRQAVPKRSFFLKHLVSASSALTTTPAVHTSANLCWSIYLFQVVCCIPLYSFYKFAIIQLDYPIELLFFL